MAATIQTSTWLQQFKHLHDCNTPNIYMAATIQSQQIVFVDSEYKKIAICSIHFMYLILTLVFIEELYTTNMLHDTILKDNNSCT